MQTFLYRLSFWFYRTSISLFSFMPLSMLYLLSSFVAILLQKVFRYRRKVLRDNLRSSFPVLSRKELKAIEERSYLNLADVLLETLKMPSMTKEMLNRHFTVKVDNTLREFCQQRRSIIILSAHFGNWEWGALAAPDMASSMKPFGFYKPLSNRFIDHYERGVRSKFGLEVVSMFSTTKTFNLHRHQPSVFFMIADQSPVDRKTAIWNDFLHQPTAWLHGPEKHSKRHNYPVFLLLSIRVRRGYYETSTLLLTDNPSSLPPGELTKRYASALEKYITRYPEQWLWTHRRWKMKPAD